MSLKQRFNTGWSFTKTKIGCECEELDTLKVLWKPVDIPHDWLIYQEDLYETSQGWYQKEFHYKPKEDELLSLYFDGVYMDSTVFVNQKEVGSWKYGYSSFEFDITDFLVEGINQIRVRVKHESPNSRWYSGAGIYRNVWLKTSHPIHFMTDSIYISTKKQENEYELVVSHELSKDEDTTVLHTLQDAKGNVILTDIKSDTITKVCGVLNWSLEQPNLYMLYSKLIYQGKVVDTQTNRFGFRTLYFDQEKGFYLNEKHIKLNGECQHHDLGALGSAFHVAAAKRQIKILKEMGVNAIRTAHNMPAPELLDLADELGLLIVNEAFDMWERSKTIYDYARFFKTESQKDVKSWICRDRNHPSVIMWSIGNEIYDTHVDKRGLELTKYLANEVKKYDARANAKVTLGSNFMAWENARECADVVKFSGYNYAEKLYHTHHKEHPDWYIYGSETASVVQSRGIYHFPLSESILSDDDRQCSSLGNSITSWGAKSLQYCVLAERDAPFSLGQFIWSGFDYIGEPTPYHTRNSYFGQIDTAGFPKDSFYFYQSAWTSYQENPMVHITPYWDFNSGQTIDVRVFSNAPCVELFLNEVSLGRQLLDHEKGDKVIADWQVAYEKGQLKALAYDEKDQVIASDVANSFGDAVKIELLADKKSMTADGEDLIFVTIHTLDEEGIVVENANNRVHVSVEGAGRLVGLDNGDSTDTDSYKESSRQLFSGKLLAIIASNLEIGEIKVKVTSPALLEDTITLEAIAPEVEPTVSALLCCKESIEQNEIPIRKIELTSKEGQLLDSSLKSVYVQATIFPNNATYDELEWQITNDAGVAIKSAVIESVKEMKHVVRITACGDGKFRLRCLCKNNKEHAQIISTLEFLASGLGELTHNPYEFISGALYSQFEGEVSNGNERGVATAREQNTVVTYENLDFGDFGSDTLVIPIFELESAPTTIRFYEDYQNEKILLGTFVYHKPSIWNVYQEEVFQLTKRLRGISSLSIEVVTHKIHIKGFQFEKKEKAFARLYATEADHIYGDTFTIASGCVEGIGNNVSLDFGQMDFGEKGITKITICGRCPIDKNTIHIQFTGESDCTEAAEFTHTKDYQAQTFDLAKISGLQTVTFIFLPGSNFDFEWFYFS